MDSGNRGMDRVRDRVSDSDNKGNIIVEELYHKILWQGCLCICKERDKEDTNTDSVSDKSRPSRPDKDKKVSSGPVLPTETATKILFRKFVDLIGTVNVEHDVRTNQDNDQDGMVTATTASATQTAWQELLLVLSLLKHVLIVMVEASKGGGFNLESEQVEDGLEEEEEEEEEDVDETPTLPQRSSQRTAAANQRQMCKSVVLLGQVLFNAQDLLRCCLASQSSST